MTDFAALDPILATYVGVSGHDDQMTDYSPAGFAARDERVRRVLADLAATPVDDQNRAAMTAMRERLELDRELHDAGLLAADLNVAASPLQSLRQVFDLMPADTEQDWANVRARVAAIPETLAGYRASLAESADRGLVPALRQVEGAAGQAKQWVDGSESTPGFFTALAERHGDGPVRADLDRAAVAANAALRDFAQFLTADLAPRAPRKDAVGRDRYALWSRYFTGTTLDLDESYAWGWDEVARIQAQIRSVAERIVPGGSVAEAVAVLENDPARRLEGAENLQAWMQDLSDRTLAALNGVHFDIPEPAQRLACRISPTPEGGAYYTAPSEDFSRPGTMWWAIPEGVTSYSTWQEKTTVFHEGVPGHHLQAAQVVYRSDRLNRYQRLMLWVSGHGEGWALYAERLMEELGHLEDPGDLMGMLEAQLFRAARVVVDIGMHLELLIPAGTGFHEGERWTPELGLELLRANSSAHEANLVNERDRYLGWPGQAPSYKIGEREWLAAREDARRRHGAAFDVKAFHSAALDLGSMGLDPLREQLALL